MCVEKHVLGGSNLRELAPACIPNCVLFPSIHTLLLTTDWTAISIQSEIHSRKYSGQFWKIGHITHQVLGYTFRIAQHNMQAWEHYLFRIYFSQNETAHTFFASRQPIPTVLLWITTIMLISLHFIFLQISQPLSADIHEIKS